MSARYITTTLPYVNADPHLGHALEFVQADVLARAWRIQGDEVFFNTGTDEHGQKIFEAAQKAGQEPRAYVDHYAKEFQKLGKALDLSYDAFIRTTDEKHVRAAQEMWRLGQAGGDIYKKAYTGLYCVGCESFKTEKEIADGGCVIHANLKLEEVTEENYFFRFSKYADKLLAYLAREEAIIPEWRRQEAIAFVREGLEDFSISREKKRLSWGISVPGDDTQVMYVWFDALTSYISALGWPNESGDFKKFWVDGKTLQVAGKDQVRFQSLMWQAMLMSAGIKNTGQVFYHGFINSGGQKMSKSLGNVISPYDLVKRYGTDATRYILLRHVHPTDDADVTWVRLDEWYTANLTNGLGNLVARVMKLSESHLDQYSGINDRTDLAPIEDFNFNVALDNIWARIQRIDQEITETEPFRVIKENAEEGKQLINEHRKHLLFIARALKAYMPTTSELIRNAVMSNKKPENLFPRI